ncbi:MAG: hypothetical protein ACTHNP_08555 [Solirubrobacterales bacterium]
MVTRKKGRPKFLVEAAARAVAHRIRVQALTIFNERVASPREVAKEIGEDLTVLVHHVNVLVESGCIELVKTVPRGGAVEHFYRAIRRPEVSAEEWQTLPDGIKRELATEGIRNLFGEALASVHTGQLSADPHVYVWWKAANLDEQGRIEAAEEQAAHLVRIQEIEARTSARMVKAGNKRANSTVIGVLGFRRSRAGQPVKGQLPQS